MMMKPTNTELYILFMKQKNKNGTVRENNKVTNSGVKDQGGLL